MVTFLGINCTESPSAWGVPILRTQWGLKIHLALKSPTPLPALGAQGGGGLRCWEHHPRTSPARCMGVLNRVFSHYNKTSLFSLHFCFLFSLPGNHRNLGAEHSLCGSSWCLRGSSPDFPWPHPARATLPRAGRDFRATPCSHRGRSQAQWGFSPSL